MGPARDNVEIQQMKIMGIARKFIADTSMHKEPVFRFPQFTRRIMGRDWPGEERRKRRFALERKETRKQAAQLCKFMLFKKGKFIPGKMV